MTIFLLIMIPVSACFGFMMCALCQAASRADRQEEKMYEQRMLNLNKEKEEAA